MQLLAVLKERFNLYLNEDEIEALFLYFSPRHAEYLAELQYGQDPSISVQNQQQPLHKRQIEARDIDLCVVKMVKGERSLQSLLLGQRDFHALLPRYTISKAQFVHLALAHYDEAQRDLSTKIATLFFEYDTSKLGGIGYESFKALMLSPGLSMAL